MTNLPKFIRIETSIRTYFINVSTIQEVIVGEDYIEFRLVDGSQVYSDDAYPIALAAWLEYWKVSP